MNTPAVCQHAFSYDDAARSTNVLLHSSWAQKYSSWVLNTYIFTAQKVAIFAEKNSKIASLMSCQRSDLRKTLKYRGYSMNTLNIYRRRLCSDSWRGVLFSLVCASFVHVSEIYCCHCMVVVNRINSFIVLNILATKHSVNTQFNPESVKSVYQLYLYSDVTQALPHLRYAKKIN